MKQKDVLGQTGEKIAATYLQNKGYKILERNWRGRFGEIDIIAQEKNQIVFVEVKARQSKDFGLPEEAVDFKKQNKLVRTALEYLQKTPTKLSFRFDVIGIEFKSFSNYKISHIKNAFLR